MISDLITKFEASEEKYFSREANNFPFVGYLCLRVPVEIIEALGAVPMRIVPRPGYDTNLNHGIRTDGCSFCRLVPGLLELPYYKNLKAIIAGSCCDQMRRLMDTLSRERNIPVILFGAPRSLITDSGYFLNEMNSAFKMLSDVLHSPLDLKKVLDRVKMRNRLRQKIRILRSKGKLPNSLLTKVAATSLPAEDVFHFLKYLDKIKLPEPEIRLFMAGSIPGIWEQNIIESHGARIVSDATCLGDRVFHLPVPEEGNVINNLYQMYVEDNLCPHRRPVTPLIDYIKAAINDWEGQSKQHIDGVVYRSLKFCHPWGLAAERIKKELQKPFLNVDDDFSSAAMGSFRTRVEAFIEMLKAGERKAG